MCEQCKAAPVMFPGATGGAGRYCTECLDVKVSLILCVHEVISFYGAQEA